MLNHIDLHGRFTKDPELRRTQAGKAVASFTLAVDRDYKNQDGTRTADFIDCLAWDKLGENVHQWFHKGSEAVVSGRLQSRDWTDKQGNKRRSWEIVCDKVEFCGGRQDGGRETTSSGAYAPPSPQGEGFAGDFAELTDDDGDVPF
jgi:single-strand DNA-binding protein